MSIDNALAPDTIAASGRIDAASAPLLDAQLLALHAAGARDIAIDMHQVTYVSSSGMRVLLVAMRRQHAVGGSLRLRDVPERVYRVLAVVGFDRVFEIQCASPASGQGCGA